MMQRRGMVASAVAAGLMARPGRAQAFPSKQLRFLVGAAPSGGVDTVARIVGQELNRRDGLSARRVSAGSKTMGRGPSGDGGLDCPKVPGQFLGEASPIPRISDRTRDSRSWSGGRVLPEA